MDLLAQLPILVRNREIIDLQGKLTISVHSLSEEEFRDGLNHLVATSMAATTNEHNRLLHHYEGAYVRWHLSPPVSLGVAVPVVPAVPVEPSTPPASPPRDLPPSAKPVRILTWEAFCDALGLVGEQRAHMTLRMKEAQAMMKRKDMGWQALAKTIFATQESRIQLRNMVAALDKNYTYQFESPEGRTNVDSVTAELLLSLQG